MPLPLACPGASVSHAISSTPAVRRSRAFASQSDRACAGGEATPVRLQRVVRGDIKDTDHNLIRAASYLRAYSFGTYPDDRSDYAKRAHLLMSAGDALEQMEQGLGISTAAGIGSAVDGTESTSAVSNVLTFFPVIATLMRYQIAESPDSTKNALSALESTIAGGVHIHIPSRDVDHTMYVCGTLDVTVGNKLPSEELVGQQGQRGDRAYLSNVCVLAPMRKRGIACTIIEGACAYAREIGVKNMYVHVVEDNSAARKLYEEKCGFTVEQKESANVARGLNRPRRLLLHRAL